MIHEPAIEFTVMSSFKTWSFLACTVSDFQISSAKKVLYCLNNKRWPVRKYERYEFLPVLHKILQTLLESSFSKGIIEHSENELGLCRCGILFNSSTFSMWISFTELVVNWVQHGHGPVIKRFVGFHLKKNGMESVLNEMYIIYNSTDCMVKTEA